MAFRTQLGMQENAVNTQVFDGVPPIIKVFNLSPIAL
jgi:hypothetical protein